MPLLLTSPECTAERKVDVVRLRKLLGAASALALAGCIPNAPAQSPSTVPSTGGVAVSMPGCVREDSVPRLSAPAASALPAPSGSVANVPSGRLVVLDRSDAGIVGRTVSQLDARGPSTVELPGILVPQPVLQMSTGGERLSGLTTEDGHAINIWSYDENTKSVTLAQTELPQGTPTAWASWSPDARHAAYLPDSQNKQSRLFLVDLAGQTEELSLHNAYVYEVAWRSNHELSLMINESGPLRPLSGATLVVWDLDRPGLTQVVTNVMAATSNHVWSPDGSAVVYQDEDVAGGPDRLVRRTAAGINVVFGATDLQRLSNGCDLVRTPTVAPLDWGWSPDAARFAVIGKMPPSECCWYLAVGAASGGVPVLFRAPENCYLNGQGAWIDRDRILVELTGPDCGPTVREGRAVVIDATTGKALGEFAVGKKSRLRLSPDHRWVVSAYQDATHLISLDNPARRIVLPVHGELVGWCC